MAQQGKNPPTVQETWFDPGVRKTHGRSERQPTPVILPGESHCSPKGSSVHGILYTQGKPFTKYNVCHHQIGCFKLDKVRHVQGGLAIDRITLILMI